MKILVKAVSAATQIHNGKCHFIGAVSASAKISNIEASGTAAIGNRVYDASNGKVCILPKPGVECTNGLYTDNSAVIYYSVG